MPTESILCPTPFGCLSRKLKNRFRYCNENIIILMNKSKISHEAY